MGLYGGLIHYYARDAIGYATYGSMQRFSSLSILKVATPNTLTGGVKYSGGACF